MSISIILVTHGNFAKALLQTITHTIGKLPLPTTTVSVSSKCDTEAVCAQLQSYIDNIESDGILILTDLFGATPHNIVGRINKNKPIRVVSGINLPMLFRIMNYPNLDLDALANCAYNGGREGIIITNHNDRATD